MAALEVLEGADLARGPELATRLAQRLGDRVAPRGRSTLVSWENDDPEAAVERLRGEGFVVRHLPGTPYVRASVGAWNTEEEVERLAAAATR